MQSQRCSAQPGRSDGLPGQPWPILNRAVWSSRESDGRHVLLARLAAPAPGWWRRPLDLRHRPGTGRGAKIRARAIYRDPVRSRPSTGRWISLMWLGARSDAPDCQRKVRGDGQETGRSFESAGRMAGQPSSLVVDNMGHLRGGLVRWHHPHGGTQLGSDVIASGMTNEVQKRHQRQVAGGKAHCPGSY